jgi:hypothetical protein
MSRSLAWMMKTGDKKALFTAAPKVSEALVIVGH